MLRPTTLLAALLLLTGCPVAPTGDVPVRTDPRPVTPPPVTPVTDAQGNVVASPQARTLPVEEDGAPRGDEPLEDTPPSEEP